jgi:hypothetical protein
MRDGSASGRGTPPCGGSGEAGGRPGPAPPPPPSSSEGPGEESGLRHNETGTASSAANTTTVASARAACSDSTFSRLAATISTSKAGNERQTRNIRSQKCDRLSSSQPAERQAATKPSSTTGKKMTACFDTVDQKGNRALIPPQAKHPRTSVDRATEQRDTATRLTPAIPHQIAACRWSEARTGCPAVASHPMWSQREAATLRARTRPLRGPRVRRPQAVRRRAPPGAIGRATRRVRPVPASVRARAQRGLRVAAAAHPNRTSKSTCRRPSPSPAGS